MAEKFVNEITPTLTLSTAITLTGATTITPSSVAALPSTGTFRIRIDNELMQATVSGSNLTVVRGDGGTTAATHLSGVSIYVIVTKESLDAICTILSNGSEIANRRALNFIPGSGISLTLADDPTNKKADITITNTGGYGTPPTISTFTTVNFSSATQAAGSGGGVTLNVVPNGGANDLKLLVVAAPSTPYNVIARIIPSFMLESGQHYTGLVFYESGTGKAVTFGRSSSAGGKVEVNQWSALPATNPANAEQKSWCWTAEWLKINDDGTTRTYSLSPDGLAWQKFYSHARTNGFTTTNDKVGIFVSSQDGSSRGAGIYCTSWFAG